MVAIAASIASAVLLATILTTVRPTIVLLGRGRDDLVLPREAPVVEALSEEDYVGDGVVDGQDDHGGQDALQDCAEDVEDIAGEPDDDELEGQSVGCAAAEVLDDLGAEDDDPACDGDGPERRGKRGYN